MIEWEKISQHRGLSKEFREKYIIKLIGIIFQNIIVQTLKNINKRS